MADVVEVAKMTAHAEAVMQQTCQELAGALGIEIPEPPVKLKARYQFHTMELYEYLTAIMVAIKEGVIVPETEEEVVEEKSKSKSRRSKD